VACACSALNGQKDSDCGGKCGSVGGEGKGAEGKERNPIDGTHEQGPQEGYDDLGKFILRESRK